MLHRYWCNDPLQCARCKYQLDSSCVLRFQVRVYDTKMKLYGFPVSSHELRRKSWEWEKVRPFGLSAWKRWRWPEKEEMEEPCKVDDLFRPGHGRFLRFGGRVKDGIIEALGRTFDSYPF